ncbi:putative toxin-antitoxin system toxin component, PIN family [Halorhodospira neutriphila]|uniref:Toxin-antitoxin system toxin component, PIN family n=1 Tax=Halorhodospira neutriphila TaxID=168379 RepID=A0ABS1E678_9GAMM|nr:putative toxin-antitoxin system toxin component, PIN family [Halorhodospira neutriphila]MBK1726642.1 putative toxin-antitoxin system toxin component, PIN family [Halorhodospira neutriphila]
MIEQSRWVLDTNTLVSRLLAPGGVAAQAVDHALDRGVLLVSDETLGELVEVLGRPKFDPYLSTADRRRFLELLGGVARVVPITRKCQACRDPKDDKFLEVAVCGEASAIVTGDQDLLALDPFHGIRVIQPAHFLTWP